MAGEKVNFRGYEMVIYSPASHEKWRVLVGPEEGLPFISFFGAGKTRDAAVLKAAMAIDAVIARAEKQAEPTFAKAA